MSEQQVFVEIPLAELLGQASQMKGQGWRFVQCHATRGAGVEATPEQEPATESDGPAMIPTFELTYSFSNDATRELLNYRVNITQDQAVPSVSVLFPTAFMFEKEMHDLFGINVEGISIDFQGGFYHLHYPAPMAQAPEKATRKAAPTKKPAGAEPAPDAN